MTGLARDTEMLHKRIIGIASVPQGQRTPETAMRDARAVTVKTYSEQIDGIARRLARLAPDYQNPERYYRRRDDLVDELVTMARRG